MSRKNLILNLGENVVVYDLVALSKEYNFDVITTAGVNVQGLNGKVKVPKDSEVMVRIEHLWNADFAVDFQSEFFLGRLPWCVVYDTLEDPSEYREEIDKIMSKVPNYAVDLGTSGDLERATKFFEIYNVHPRYIFSPLNPLKYRSDIIEYCRTNEIDLIATEIYGNKESEEWMKETFTTDYLERFASYHSSGIELKIDTMLSTDFIYTLRSFEENKRLEDFGELFSMSKDVWTDKVKPAQRKVMSCGIFDGSKFTWHSSRNSGRAELSFKKEATLSETHKEVMRILDDFKFPENFTDLDKKRYSDMLGISTIATENPRYKMKYNIMGDITIITMTNKYLPWKKKSYICSYTPEAPFIIEFGVTRA